MEQQLFVMLLFLISQCSTQTTSYTDVTELPTTDKPPIASLLVGGALLEILEETGNCSEGAGHGTFRISCSNSSFPSGLIDCNHGLKGVSFLDEISKQLDEAIRKIGDGTGQD